MPLQNLARSIRSALHRGPKGADTAGSSQPKAKKEESQASAVIAGMPSNLYIPQRDIDRLQRSTFRPADTISGVVRAQALDTFGNTGGYSFVEATFSLWIRLIKTTTEEYYYGGSSFATEREYYDEEDLEDSIYQIGRETLLDATTDGPRGPGTVDLPFEFTVPKEAEGQLLPPTMGDYVQYFISIRAVPQDTGKEVVYFLENLRVVPFDDGSGAGEAYPSFLMRAPYQPVSLLEQRDWEDTESWTALLCPSKNGRSMLEKGSVKGALYVPAFDVLSESPFPVVLELTAVAPASYDEREIDWESFRPPLIHEEGAKWVCKVQTRMEMMLEKSRGGDGEVREREVYDYEKYFRWEHGHLKRKNIFPAWSSEGRSSGAEKEAPVFELPGYGWSAPVRDPSAGGVWVSQAWITGSICLPLHVTPDFDPTDRDEFSIFNVLWVKVPVPSAAEPLEFGLYKRVRNVSGLCKRDGSAGTDDPPPRYK